MMWKKFTFQFAVLDVAVLLSLFAAFGNGYKLNDSLISNERRLYRYLLEDYEKSVRPVANELETLDVELGFVVTAVEDLEEVNQALYTTGWLRLIWTDIQLQWNQEEFGGVENIRIPVSELWTPDLVVVNSLDADNAMPLQHTMAHVAHDGTVLWVPPVNLRTVCTIDLTNFPFDEQLCHIKFISWTYNEQMVNISKFQSYDETEAESEMLSEYIGNPEWQLTRVSAQRHSVKYPCCPEAYVDVVFYLNLRRVPTFASHLFLAPSITLSLIIPAVFLLPPGTSDKMIMGTGVLVAHVLLLGELIKYVPSEHERVPLMGQFFLANIVLVSLSLVVSAVVINLWARARSRIVAPPAVVRMIFLNPVVTRLLLIDFTDYDEMKVLRRDDFEHPGSVEVMSDIGCNPSVRMTDDRVHIMTDSQHRLSRADWHRLAIVIDRMFFVLFLLLVIAISLAYIKHL